MTTFISRLRRVGRQVTLEPMIFFQTFSWGLGMVIGQNLLIAKCCRDLGFAKQICEDINHHPKENDEVESRVSVIQMYSSILAALPSIVLSLFVGPWSDKNGRKPVILVPVLGFFFSQIAWIANVYYMDAPAIYLLSTSVYAWFGGFACLLIGVFSYITDVTSTRSRTSRIAVLDFCMFGGVPLGTFLSPYVFDYFGYYGIFGLVAVCQVVSALYIVIFVTETVRPSDNSLTVSSSRLRNFLAIIDINHVKEVFQTTFRKRQHRLRRVIALLIFSMLLNITAFSDGNILYLYTRKVFFWTEKEFTRFQTISICFSAAASLIFMPLLSYWLKVHDAMIGILATMSKIASLVVIAIAKDGYGLLLGASLGCISGLSGIVIRSMLSKCVHQGELGKIYSLLASLEAAVPLLAAPLFTYIYNNTLDSMPGAVFLASACIFLVALFVFIYVFYSLTRTGTDFSLLVEEEERDAIESLVEEQNAIAAVPS